MQGAAVVFAAAVIAAVNAVRLHRYIPIHTSQLVSSVMSKAEDYLHKKSDGSCSKDSKHLAS